MQTHIFKIDHNNDFRSVTVRRSTNMEHIDDIGVKAYEKALPLQRRSSWVRLQIGLANIGKLFRLWVLCLGVYVKKRFTPVKVKNLDNQVVLVTGGANGLGMKTS
jgi:hypothetical protein